MVLGHECVFCWGGPEQRAVHKGCGMEEAEKAGQAERQVSKNGQENGFRNVTGL